MPSYDPRDESVICQVAEAGEADIDIAVKCARDAFESGSDHDTILHLLKKSQKSFAKGVWSTRSGFYRSRILHKWADLLEANAEYITKLETWDNGKRLFLHSIHNTHTFSTTYTALTYSKLDLHFCTEYIRYFAGWADKIQGKTLPNNDVLGMLSVCCHKRIHNPLTQTRKILFLHIA